MPLTLSLLNYGEPPPAQISFTFDERGGTVGRNPDNDWVIPDAHKQISRTHATIEYRMGAYFIIDGSSNGIFRNEETTRLPAGQPVQLQDGDRLMFGNFQVRTAITAEQPAPPPRGIGFGDPVQDPFSHVISQPNEFSSDGRHLNLDEDSLDSVNPFAGAFEQPPPAGPADLPGGASPSAMPDVLDLAGGPVPGLPSELVPDLPAPAARTADPQHTPAHRDAFDPLHRRTSPSADTEQPDAGPVRTPPPLVPDLPTQWKVRADTPTDDSDGEFELPDPLPERADEHRAAPLHDPFREAVEPEAPVLRPQPPPAPTPPPQVLTPRVDAPPPPPEAPPAPVVQSPAPPIPAPPAPASPAPGNFQTQIDEDFLDIFADPAAAAAPAPGWPAPAAPPPAPPSPPAVPSPAPQAAQPAPQAHPAASAPGTAHPDAVQALLRGMGLDPAQFGSLSGAQDLETLGKVLREAVRGTREVLMVRAKIRNEFRVQGTMLRASENNPLKFSVTTEDALKKLLQRTDSGFLDPIEAIREAFHDLASHEMATLTGMRAGLHDVLARFEPTKLEQRLNKEGLLNNLLPSNRKAQLWDMFCEHYRAILVEAENDFEELFGRQFAQAYEREMRHLRRSARTDEGTG